MYMLTISILNVKMKIFKKISKFTAFPGRTPILGQKYGSFHKI